MQGRVCGGQGERRWEEQMESACRALWPMEGKLSPHGRVFWGQGSDPVGSIQELWEDGRLCVKEEARKKLLPYPEQRW